MTEGISPSLEPTRQPAVNYHKVFFLGRSGKMGDRLCRCLLVVCVFYLCFRLTYGVLYSTADHIVLLENNTISNVIQNSPSAWLVEFYSSFCGHCHAFAPTWKKLAKMAKGKGMIS